MARGLRGVEIEPSRFVVAGKPFVRLVDPATVAFMTGDRDAVIAKSPEVYFTNDRFADMPVVLAHLDKLEADDARERVRAAYKLAAPAEQQKSPKSEKSPAKPRLFYLGYVTDGDKPERRKFKKLGRGTALEWLQNAWRRWSEGKPFGEDKIPDDHLRAIADHFDRIVDEEMIENIDAELPSIVQQSMMIGPHMVSEGDDFEGVSWELYIFDEEYFGEERSDYLPHPARGEREKNADDGYRELLTKHGKHLRTR